MTIKYSPKARDYKTLLFATGITTAGDYISLSGLTYLLYASTQQLHILSYIQAASAILVASTSPLIAPYVDTHSSRNTIVYANFALAIASVLISISPLSIYIILWSIKDVLRESARLSTDRLLPTILSNDSRQTALGAYGATQHTSAAIGLALGPVLAHSIGTSIFLLDALTFAIGGILVKSLFHDAPVHEHQSMRQGLLQKHRAYLALAYGYISRSRRRLALLAVFLLAHLAWGMKDIIGIALLSQHFSVRSELYGFYSAVATLGEIVIAAIIMKNLINTDLTSPRRITAYASMLGISIISVLLGNSEAWAFATKFLEGVSSFLLGVFAGNYLILRAPAPIRASVSASLMSLSLLSLAIGKYISGQALQIANPQYIYAAFGTLLLASSLAGYAYIVITDKQALSRRNSHKGKSCKHKPMPPSC